MSDKVTFSQLWRAWRKSDKSIAKRALSYMSDPDAWLVQSLYGAPADSGVNVTERTAMELSSFYSGVTVLSKITASLPAILYERIDRGKERATEHKLYDVLHLKPNPEQVAFDFYELMMVHAVVFGNFYAEKVYDGSGQVRELWPLVPWAVTVDRVGAKRVFRLNWNGIKKTLPAERVLHIHGMTFDGVKGLSPVHYQRQALGLSLAADKYGASFFANDGRPGGVLKTEKALNQEAVRRMRKDWEDTHSEWGNKHRVAILEEGLEWQAVGTDPDKAQSLETRKHQVTEVARMLDLPPHMIGDLEHATYSNIEQQGLEFVIFKLRPWLVRIEQNLTTQLLPRNEWKTHFVEFLVDALLRGDIQSRFAAYRTGSEIAVYSPNDIREKENMNPYEGGDVRHVPLNWVEIGTTPDPKEQPRAPIGVREYRSERSARTRSRIAHSYRHVMHDAIDKIVQQERRAIHEAVGKQLTERGKLDFDMWITEYYSKLPDEIRRRIAPVLTSLAEAVRGEVADEIAIGAELTDEDREFLQSYMDAYVARYVGSSAGQLRAILRDAEGMDAADEIIGRVDEWGDRRAGKEALRESVRASNALSKAVYIAAGITLFRWVALGSETCEFCQQLNGKVVGSDQTFVLEGGSVESEDGKRLHVQRKITHPPVHDGCVCQIVAG